MVVFPVALVRDGGSFAVFEGAAPFVGPDGVQHPSDAWRFWTPEDWEAMCLGWRVLPLIDETPADGGKRAERLPEGEWAVTPDAVRVMYRTTDTFPEEMADALVAARALAVSRANREAGEARSRFITVTVGQEGTYLEKGREARAFLADPAPAPAPANYPYLSAEAEGTDQPIAVIATLVVATAAAWTPINAKIEGLRQGALKAIKDAGNPVAVAAVFPIDWPAPA